MSHLPVAVPAPSGRSLADLTDEEVEHLVAQACPSPWLGLVGVPLFVGGVIAAAVGAGTLALWACIQWGLGSLPTAAAMVVAVLAGVPSFSTVTIPLARRLARASTRRRVDVAVARLTLETAAADEVKAWLMRRGPRPRELRCPAVLAGGAEQVLARSPSGDPCDEPRLVRPSSEEHR